MEKNYEITEKQLAFLEDYIKRKKRFSDPEDLYELVDHLVTDFEYTGNGNISQYLADNSTFIFNYQGTRKNKESAVHWSYQRQLWQNFFNFFYHLKYIPFTILYLVTFYTLFTLNIKIKTIGYIFITTIILFLFYGLLKTYHKNKKIRNLVSFKTLGNVMALPSLFLYFFSPIADFLKENRILFFIYFSIAFGLHIAGILLIKEKRKIILEKYKHLLN
ncbi:MAG: hypothetical protein AB8B78_03625 [Polaribacter sp.]